jgi:CheY-like chemotaxis protein
MNSANAPIQSVVPPAKILVVDDNSLLAKTISFKLKGAGYQVATALDGAEAMSAVRRDKPDLILLDIVFPDDFGSWDGFRIMDWLHRMEDSRKIPIIIITGSDDVKNEERARAAGAAAFFRKPIDHDGLLKVIRALLSRDAPKLD